MKQKTLNCIHCGKPAIVWSGHVIKRVDGILFDYDKKIVAGFCLECSYLTHAEPENGCFGEYNKNLMGDCISYKV